VACRTTAGVDEVVAFAPDACGSSAAHAVTSDIAPTATQAGERSLRTLRSHRLAALAESTDPAIASTSPRRLTASRSASSADSPAD
jgi:hypothetical protein